MKATIKDVELEGTPTEIGELLKAYNEPTTSQRRKLDVIKSKPKQKTVIVPFSKHRRHKQWSAEEDKYLLQKKAEGRKDRLIAKDLGRTKGAIGARLYDLRHPDTRNTPTGNRGTRKNQPWTEQEEQVLRRSIQERASYKTIARQLNRTNTAIRIRAQRLGVKR